MGRGTVKLELRLCEVSRCSPSRTLRNPFGGGAPVTRDASFDKQNQLDESWGLTVDQGIVGFVTSAYLSLKTASRSTDFIE
jgi:hypothetical protein